MYLRGSKWSMRRRRRPINWFLVAILLVLIAFVVYVDRVVVPAVPPPFVPTATATREPKSFVAEAQTLFEQGKLNQSIEAYQEAIRANPGDPTIYIAQAHVQLFVGKFEDALVNAENALLLDPNNSMAHTMRGAAQTQKGDYPNAEISLKRALELDPNNGIAHAYYTELIGNEYLNNTGPLNAIELASAESKLAISLAPNALESHRARGFILEITANYEEAIQEYQNAIAINGFIPELHLDLGRMYRALGVTDQAIQEYTLAKTLNPSDPRPDLYASRALAAVGAYPQAVQYAEQAVQTSPTDPYLRGNWGVMLYKHIQFPEAIAQLSLVYNGGTTEDGQTIESIPLEGDNLNDLYVVGYYFTYTIALARSERCGEAIPVAQLIINAVPTNDDAIITAQEAIRICQESLLTPSPAPTGAITPTP